MDPPPTPNFIPVWAQWLGGIAATLITILTPIFSWLATRKKAKADEVEILHSKMAKLEFEVEECHKERDQMRGEWDREKEAMKDAWEKKEQQFQRLIFDLNAEKYAAIVVCDDTGKIVEWDAGAVSMFHWTRQAVLGKNITVIIPEERRQEHDAAFRKMVAAHKIPSRPEPMDLTAVTRDGERIAVAITLRGWDESAKDPAGSKDGTELVKARIFVAARVVRRYE